MASNGTTWINLMMGYLDKTHLEEINKIFTEFENKIFSSDYNFDEIKQVINKNIPEILDADLLKIEQRLNEIRNVISSKVENINNYTLSEIDFKDEFNEIRDVDVFEKRKAMMKTIEDNISYNKPIHVTGKSEMMDDVYKSRNPFFAPTLNLDLFEGIYGYKPFINNSLFEGFDQKEFLKYYSKVMVFKIESNVKVFEFGLEYEQNIYALNKLYEHDQKTLRNFTGRIYITNLLSNAEELDYKLVVYSGDTDGLQKYQETLGPEFYFKCFKDSGYLYIFCEDVKPFRLIAFCIVNAGDGNNRDKILYMNPLNEYYTNNTFQQSEIEKKQVTFPDFSDQVGYSDYYAFDESHQFNDMTYKIQLSAMMRQMIQGTTPNILSGDDFTPPYSSDESKKLFLSPFDAVKMRQYNNKFIPYFSISEKKLISYLENNTKDIEKEGYLLTKGMKPGSKLSDIFANIVYINKGSSMMIDGDASFMDNLFSETPMISFGSKELEDKTISNNILIFFGDSEGICLYKELDSSWKIHKINLQEKYGYLNTVDRNYEFDHLIVDNISQPLYSSIFQFKKIELDKISNFPNNIDKDSFSIDIVQDISESDYFTTNKLKRNIEKTKILFISHLTDTTFNINSKLPFEFGGQTNFNDGELINEYISEDTLTVEKNENTKLLEFTPTGVLGNCYFSVKFKSNNIRYKDNIRNVSFDLCKYANLTSDITSCKISNLEKNYNTQVLNIESNVENLIFEVKDEDIVHFDPLSRTIIGLKEGITILTITAEDKSKFLLKNQLMIVIKVEEVVIEQTEIDLENDLTEEEKNIINTHKSNLQIIQNPDNFYVIRNVEHNDPEIPSETYQVEEMHNFNGLLECEHNLLILNRRFVRKLNDVVETTDKVLDIEKKEFDEKNNLDNNDKINRELFAYQFPYCPSSISLVDNRLIVFFVKTLQEDGTYDFSGKKYYYSDDLGNTWNESEDVLPYSIAKEEGGWISRTSEDLKVLFLLKVGEYSEDVENKFLVSYDKGETWKEFPLNLETYFPIKKNDSFIKTQLRDFAVNYDGTIINLIDCNGKIYYHKDYIDPNNIENTIWVKGERFDEFNYNTHADVKFVNFFQRHVGDDHEKVQNIIVYRDNLYPEYHRYIIEKNDLDKSKTHYYHDEQYILDAKTRLYPFSLTHFILHPYAAYDIYNLNRLGLPNYNNIVFGGLNSLDTSIHTNWLYYNSLFFYKFNMLLDGKTPSTSDVQSRLVNMHGRPRVYDYPLLYKDYFGMDFQVLFSISDTSAFSEQYNCSIGKFLDIEELYKRKQENNEVLEFTISLPKVGLFTADGFAYSGEKIGLSQTNVSQKLFRIEIKSLDYTNDIINFNKKIHKYIKDRISSTDNIEGMVQYEITILHNVNPNDYQNSDICQLLHSSKYKIYYNSNKTETYHLNDVPLVNFFDAIGSYNINETDKNIFIRYYKNRMGSIHNDCKSSIQNLDELENWYNLQYSVFGKTRFDLEKNNIHFSEKVTDPLKDLENIFKKDNKEIIGSIITVSVTIYPTNLETIVDYKQSIKKSYQSGDTNDLEIRIENDENFISVTKNIIYHNENLN